MLYRPAGDLGWMSSSVQHNSWKWIRFRPAHQLIEAHKRRQDVSIISPTVDKGRPWVVHVVTQEQQEATEMILNKKSFILLLLTKYWFFQFTIRFNSPSSTHRAGNLPKLHRENGIPQVHWVRRGPLWVGDLESPYQRSWIWILIRPMGIQLSLSLTGCEQRKNKGNNWIGDDFYSICSLLQRTFCEERILWETFIHPPPRYCVTA